MLKPVREMVGLGNSPEQFSTNASEAMLKVKVDHKQCELPVFVEKMKS